MQKKLDMYITKIPALELLKSPNLQTRHWKMFEETTEQPDMF